MYSKQITNIISKTLLISFAVSCGNDSAAAMIKNKKDLRQLEASIGKLSRPGKSYHCMAFAISKEYLVTSTDCVKLRYDGEPDERDFLFDEKGTKKPAYLEVAYDHKKMAFLKVDADLTPLKRGFGKADSIILFDGYKKDLKREFADELVEPFVKKDILYHTFETSNKDAGSPILNSKGEYMGIHLGTAWHKGFTYGIGSYHGRDFDIFDTVSYKPDVKKSTQ